VTTIGRSNGNEKVTSLPESGLMAKDGHTEPAFDRRRRIEEDSHGTMEACS
jgi:hypothetical protein